jgi:predicted metal-dependent phosphoesterase TrpH
MFKADLHIHSNYSFDCGNTLDGIIKCCLKKGINCIAISDHGTAEGALKMKQLAPFKVIVAEEILTPFGEVMGMFLKETIPTNIPVEEAISRIKEQDGIVCIPHPFDKYNRSGLGKKVLERYIKDIDVIEAFNSRSPLPWNSSQSRLFAERYGKAKSAGSDSHTLAEIGSTFVEMPKFEGKEDFLDALRQGRIHGHMANPLVHFGSLWARVRKNRDTV